MRRTSRLLTFGALCAALLVGCTPELSPTPSPSPSTEPVFASEEEALAAAEATYAEFLATMDAIFADGGRTPERLLQVSSDEVYAHEASGFANMRSEGRSGTGHVTFSMKLQSFTDSGTVTTYVCEDISETDILDEHGVSQVVPGRMTLLGYEVRFEGTPLVVSSRTFWTGPDLCE